MLTFIVLGIIQGAVVGLLALGIVLVYKGSRVFNFAQAEFATLGAFFLYFAIDVINVPYLFGMLLAVAGVGAVGFLVERLVVRPLFDAPRVTLLVATAGLALLAIALEVIIGGAQIRSLAPAIQRSTLGFKLFGATVTGQQILMLAVLGGLAAGLAYFFKKTDLGLAVLATSQEPVATELVGIGTRRMSSFVWTFAAVLGGTAGVLQGPDSGFFPGFMTRNFLLLAFTAAVLGGITSLAGAFIGGMAIGVAQQIGLYLDANVIPEGTDIPGIPDLLIFIMLISVLLVRPQGLLGSEA